MSNKQKVAIVVCALIVSFFWLMWDLFTGQVPALKELKVFFSVWQLPFPLPRHLDAIVFPVFLWIFMKTWDLSKKEITLVVALEDHNSDFWGGCVLGGVVVLSSLFVGDIGVTILLSLVLAVFLPVWVPGFFGGLGFSFSIGVGLMIFYHGIIGEITTLVLAGVVYTAVAVKGGFRLLHSQLWPKKETTVKAPGKVVA